MKNALAVALFLSAPAWAEPASKIDGSYRLVSVNDGKQTVTIADVYAKANARGELVLSFANGALSLGVWGVGKEEAAERPGEILFSACRAEQTLTPPWKGDHFQLDSKLTVSGWSSAQLVAKTKKAQTTKTSNWSRNMACSFFLDKASYGVKVVKSDSTGATNLEIDSSTGGILLLERTAPIDKADIAGAIKAMQ